MCDEESVVIYSCDMDQVRSVYSGFGIYFIISFVLSNIIVRDATIYAIWNKITHDVLVGLCNALSQ